MERSAPASIGGTTGTRTYDVVPALATITPRKRLILEADKESGQISAILTVRNICDTQITYKVHSTSPDGYTIRPHRGRLEPDEEADVAVVLNEANFEVQRTIEEDRLSVVITPAVAGKNGEREGTCRYPRTPLRHTLRFILSCSSSDRLAEIQQELNARTEVDYTSRLKCYLGLIGTVLLAFGFVYLDFCQ